MLSINEINAHMEKLEGWDLDLNVLTKSFVFDNSAKVLIFVDKILELADVLNHHPEIVIHTINVRLNLFTKEENNITMKDFELAEAIEKMLKA